MNISRRSVVYRVNDPYAEDLVLRGTKYEEFQHLKTNPVNNLDKKPTIYFIRTLSIFRKRNKTYLVQEQFLKERIPVIVYIKRFIGHLLLFRGQNIH